MSEALKFHEVLFDPPTISTRTEKSIREAGKNGSTSYNIGIPGLDQYYVMARANKINGIVADTSQGKTTVLGAMARAMAKQIDIENDEIGLFVTWEDTIEDFGMSDIASYSKIPVASLYHGNVKENELKRMLQGAAQRAAAPLWVMGQSEQTTKLQPQFTMTDVSVAMDYLINKQGKKIKFVILDYLQSISRNDVRDEPDGRLQFSAVMNKVKEMTMSFHPCTWIGSQISRSKAEKVKWRQPGIHWAMETANFEHRCDGAISLWLPWKSLDVWKPDECLQEKQGVDGKAIFVRPETMLIEVLKQKKAETGKVQAVDFMPEYSTLIEYDTAIKYRQEVQNEI
jgi:hypothetical protein